PLPTYENGELDEDGLSMMVSEVFDDPANLYERKARFFDLLEQIAKAALRLTRTEYYALVCWLKDIVDDPLEVVEAFGKYGREVESIHWPTGKKALQS